MYFDDLSTQTLHEVIDNELVMSMRYTFRQKMEEKRFPSGEILYRTYEYYDDTSRHYSIPSKDVRFTRNFWELVDYFKSVGKDILVNGSSISDL